ncbi:MAG: N-acetylmuramoyl-L-alanine amidase [Kiloniellales bacterium]|nr:N-acetylmuramoyl-L-alanine amidase [Kiloniellales bacterium]
MQRFVLALVFAVFGFGTAQASPEVREVRFGEHPDKIRFVLELSEALAFRAFTLPDPFRVVVDLSEAEWLAPERGGQFPVGPIKAMRQGRFEAGVMRVVLDLDRPVNIVGAFILPPKGGKPHRFVMDLSILTNRETAVGAVAAGQERVFVSKTPLQEPLPRIAELRPRRKPLEAYPMIIIDPGHGGVDPGGMSVAGYNEKTLTLEYGKALRAALLATKRYRVTMTREDDRFIKLRDRIAVAQRAGGQLFISLHANTHPSNKIRGASVYTVSEKASDEEAARLAESENAADVLAGINLAHQPDDVRDILLDLTWRETKNLSKQFADTMISKVGKVNPLLPNAHRFAGFAVLKSPSVPSILLEIGYMSNPAEARKLRSEAHREKIVRSIIKAIDDYFEWQQMVSRS